MSDSIVPFPDPETLESAPLADADAEAHGDDDGPGSGQDRTLHLLLTAWTMVLEEEQAKK